MVATARTARTARPKPQDHLKPAKAEAEGAGITVLYAGHTYEVPSQDSWDMDVLDVAMTQPQKALKMVIGDEQYAAFRSRHRTVGELSAVWEAIYAAAGLGN